MQCAEKPETKHLIIATVIVVMVISVVAFLNYQADDEIYIGSDDYTNVPECADDSGGVILLDDTMGAVAGSVMAETKDMHVDAGTFLLDVDHQNDEDISVEILDGDSMLVTSVLSRESLNSRIPFSAKNNAYNLKIRFIYSGEGQAILKRSIIYSTGRAFYSDTLVFAILIILAIAIMAMLMIRHDYFHLPLIDRLCFGVIFLYLLLINYMYYRPFPLGGEDVGYHLARIEATCNEMRNGQMPIVMYSDFVQGRGMIGIMYPYLFLIIPALFRALHVSPEGSLRLFFILITYATCATSYYASKRLLKNRNLAVASMMLYGMLLYRITTMTYRYAYGELQAFVFFPLVILGLYEIVVGNSKKWLVLVFGMTGLMQCHLLSFMQASVLCLTVGLLFIVNIIKEKRYAQITIAVLTVLLMNFWYIVPFLTYYREELAINEHLSWGNQIYGYSSYLTEMLRLFPNTSEGETQHKMSLVGIWLVALALVAVYYQLKMHERTSREKFASVLFVLGIVSLFMASKEFPWETVMKIDAVSNTLGYLQFVGRFYMVGEICLFFGAIILIDGSSDGNRLLIQGLMISIISVAALQAYSMTDRWLSEKADAFCDSRMERYIAAVNDTSVEDYVPEGYWFGEGFVDEVTSPMADITDYSHEQLHTSLGYKSTEPTYVEIPVLYYEGYRAIIGDKTTLELNKGRAGCIRIELPESTETTTVNVDFCGFKSWKVALLISFITTLLCFVFITKRFFIFQTLSKKKNGILKLRNG